MLLYFGLPHIAEKLQFRTNRTDKRLSQRSAEPTVKIQIFSFRLAIPLF
jgi:hypothetical protein